MNSWHVRAYSALLRVYPRRFRAEYRREMVLLFAQQLQDARATNGAFGVGGLWIHSLVDLMTTAPVEHLEREVLVAQPVLGRDQPRTRPDRASRIAWMIAALAPAFMILLMLALAPHFMDPMVHHKVPDMFGLPMGTVITAASAIWYGIGVAVVWGASRTISRLLGFAVFIAPATFAFVLGPALIFIMENLTATPAP